MRPKYATRLIEENGNNSMLKSLEFKVNKNINYIKKDEYLDRQDFRMC